MNPLRFLKEFFSQAWTIKLWSTFIALSRRVSKYYGFVFSIIFWTALFFWLLPFLVALFNAYFGSSLQVTFSDFALLLTAAFILAYTYETQRLKEETILQRRMSSATDVEFSMVRPYVFVNQTLERWARVYAPTALHNVSRFTFLTPFGFHIGHSRPFVDEDGTLCADYRIETQEGRNAFLNALRLQNGVIKALVQFTNGESFIYSFLAHTENWKLTLEGHENLEDIFILIKKELDD